MVVDTPQRADNQATVAGEHFMRNLKIVIEKHRDGFVAYPLGLKGVVVGEGDTYDEALSDVQSAIRFHIETFGAAALEDDALSVEEVFVADAKVDV